MTSDGRQRVKVMKINQQEWSGRWALVTDGGRTITMWSRQLESLLRTLKNIYCASGQQSYRCQGNERLNHHKEFGPC